MYRFFIAVILIFFQLHGAGQVGSVDSMYLLQKNKVDSLVNIITRDHPGSFRPFSGNSDLGEFSGKYTLTNDGIICRVSYRFAKHQPADLTFFYTRDTVVFIQMAGKNYYRLNDLFIADRHLSNPAIFPENILVFERKQFAMLKVLSQ